MEQDDAEHPEGDGENDEGAPHEAIKLPARQLHSHGCVRSAGFVGTHDVGAGPCAPCGPAGPVAPCGPAGP